MISINLTKAKNIAHVKRREAREKEFAPFDEVIVKQIPGTDVAAVEAERQKIRDKYAVIQAHIDEAVDTNSLLNIVKTL